MEEIREQLKKILAKINSHNSLKQKEHCYQEFVDLLRELRDAIEAYEKENGAEGFDDDTIAQIKDGMTKAEDWLFERVLARVIDEIG